MEEGVKDNVELINKYWYSKSGGIVLFVGVFAIICLINFTDDYLIKALVALIVSLLALFFRHVQIYRYLPLKEDKVNLIFSIKIEENQDLKRKLENDFIREINKNFQNKKHANVIKLNPVLVEKYDNDGQQILKFLDKKYKTHRIIFITGIVKERAGTYHMETNLYWNHEKIDILVNKNHEKEISKYCGKDQILAENQVNRFKIRADTISFAIDLVNIIFLETRQEYQSAYCKSLELLKEKKNKNLISITDIYDHIFFNLYKILKEKYDLFFYKNERKELNEMCKIFKENKNIINDAPPSKYKESLYNCYSILVFLLTKNTKKVRKYVKKIIILKENRLISEAFLFAYDDNVKDCKRRYERLEEINFHSAQILETESFICKILEENSEKNSLNFCLGYINLFFKGEKELAKDYFLEFMNNDSENNINNEIKQWIG